MLESNTEARGAAGEGPVTLFDVFLEYLSNRDLWPFIAVVLAMVGYLASADPGWRDVLWFLCGLVIFIPTEYLTHVYILHRRLPKSKGVYFWMYRVHYGHHDFPKRSDLMHMPLGISLPLTGLNLALIWLIAGEMRATIAAFSGFLTGYVVFEWAHLLCHVPCGLKTRLWRFIRSHHALHHYYDENRWFAVTQLMDHVAGTGGMPGDSPRTESARYLGLNEDHPWLHEARARFAARSTGDVASSGLWLRAAAHRQSETQ